MDLPAIIAQHLQGAPQPDAPRGAKRTSGAVHPTGYKTSFVNGKWVLVPTGYASGKSTLPPPRVIVKPLR